MEIGADGSVVSTRRFKDTGSTVAFSAMGIAQTAGGEVLIAGGSAPNHTYQLVKTSPDLTVGCADTALQAPVEIASTAASLAATNTSFTATITPVTGTPVTFTPNAPESVTPVDQCKN